MKTYLIPTTAHVAVKLNQQLLQTSDERQNAHFDGNGESNVDAN